MRRVKYAYMNYIPIPEFVMASSSSSAPASNPPAVATEPPLPNATTLQHAAKLSIKLDCPIQLDYFVESISNKVFLGEDKKTGEKVLVKSRDEFTSLVQKLYKVGEEFLIQTENSIYIVSGKIQRRAIDMSSLYGTVEA